MGEIIRGGGDVVGEGGVDPCEGARKEKRVSDDVWEIQKQVIV